MTIAKVLLSAVTLACLTAVLVVDPLKGEGPKKLEAPPTEKEIKALIEQLVSPNPKPIVNKRGAPEIELPPGFVLKKQEKVHAARSRLMELGLPAFPLLIESENDERYSLTTSDSASGWYTNESIGHICKDILFGQLQPYGFWPKLKGEPQGKPKRPSYPARFLNSQEAAKAWWEKNKGKTLYQMQVEVVDWVIAEEAKRPGDFIEEEKQYLQKTREKLVDSGKPLPVGSYYGDKITYSDRD
jgi:hypothetical protein